MIQGHEFCRLCFKDINLELHHQSLLFTTQTYGSVICLDQIQELLMLTRLEMKVLRLFKRVWPLPIHYVADNIQRKAIQQHQVFRWYYHASIMVQDGLPLLIGLRILDCTSKFRRMSGYFSVN